MPVDTVANAAVAEREFAATSGEGREQMAKDILNDLKMGPPEQKAVAKDIERYSRGEPVDHLTGSIQGYLENVRVHGRLNVPTYPIRSDLSDGGRRRRKTRRGKKSRRTRKSRR